MKFAAQVAAFNEKAIKNTERVKRAAIIEILSGVVLLTPVDTGRARGNWQTTIGRGSSNILDETDKNGTATINKGHEAARLVVLGDEVYISNNLPYISRLNSGSSTQAPAGFVEATVMRVKNNLRTNDYRVD